MRYRVTLFLLVSCAILFALIIYLEKKNSRINAGNAENIGLFRPEILAVDRLELRGPALKEGQERVVVKKADGQWQIKKPMVWPANFFFVNQILNQVQFLPRDYSFTVDSILKAGKSLEDYGLEVPRLELTLGWGEDRQIVAFGEVAEMGGKIFMLGPSRRNIYAVSKQLGETLLQDLAFWQSQEVFTIPVIEVDSFSLQINDSGNLTNIRLEKTAQEWNLEAPIKARADTTLVNNSINRLQGVKVLSFLDGKDKKEAEEALLKPIIRITLHGSSYGQTLELGQPLEQDKPYFYARLDAYQTSFFTVSSESFLNLRNAQTYFRQKRFLTFKATSISGIQVKNNDRTAHLQKLEGGDWQVQKVGEAHWLPAENPIVDQLLNLLSSLKAISFPHDAPSLEDLNRLGLESPLQTITLKSGEDKEPIILHVGQAEKEQALYVKLATVPFVYEVDPRLAGQIHAHPLHFRNRTIFTANPVPKEAMVRDVKLSSLPAKTILLEHSWAENKESPSPAPETPAPIQKQDPDEKEILKARETLLLELGNHVRDLRAKDFMEQGFQDKFFEGPDGQMAWRYLLEATYLLPEGNEPAEMKMALLLTERIAGNQQGAGNAANGTAFTLRQETIDLLQRTTPQKKLPEDYRPPPKDESSLKSEQKPPTNSPTPPSSD